MLILFYSTAQEEQNPCKRSFIFNKIKEHQRWRKMIQNRPKYFQRTRQGWAKTADHWLAFVSFLTMELQREEIMRIIFLMFKDCNKARVLIDRHHRCVVESLMIT